MTTAEQPIETVGAATVNFLARVHQGNTQALYRYGLKAFRRFLAGEDQETSEDDHLPDFPLADLNNNLLADFYGWLVSQYDTPHTVQTYLSTVQRFLLWLDANDRLPSGFQLGKAQSRLKAAQGERGVGGYKHRQVDPALPSIVTYFDELELPEPDKPSHRRQRLIILRNRAIVHILYASAGRLSEIAALTRDQVLEGRLDEVQIVGKGDKTRMILLTTEARQAIRTYLKARGNDGIPALFTSHGHNAKGKPLTPRAIQGIIKEAAQALDLAESTSPHDFRHFRATQLLNEGMPLELVQTYLGHADISTTRKVYAHTNTATLREQFERFHRSPDEAMANLADKRDQADQSARRQRSE